MEGKRQDYNRLNVVFYLYDGLSIGVQQERKLLIFSFACTETRERLFSLSFDKNGGGWQM